MPRSAEQQVAVVRAAIYELRMQAPLLEEQLEEVRGETLEHRTRLDELSRRELALQRQLEGLETILSREREEGERLTRLLKQEDWLL